SGTFGYGPHTPSRALGALGARKAGHASNVHGEALIAAGLLLLALAAHLLYLRGAVSRFGAAQGVGASRPAHRRQKRPMQIQWSQWPPVVRAGNDLSPPG
ncbi:MAG: hypothetical protein M3256_07885, partial [Actinomycetota bacterium]|nr:hypothetical protein [Actinomycetota bacterium]